MKRLDGKVALITGGAAGIGRAIAQRFRHHGAKVCIVDIQDDVGREVCRELGGAPDAVYFHCDVTVEEEVGGAVDFVVGEYGALDIMVNNAGVLNELEPDIREAGVGEFERVMEVNVKGVFAGMKHAARAMIPPRSGSIVSLSSVSSVVGGLVPHAYTASKAAVVGLTRSVAAELGMCGIRVNCVSPYLARTNMTARYLFPDRAKLLESDPIMTDVIMTVDDIVDAVVYVASDEARGVHGQNLIVDAGLTSVNHRHNIFRHPTPPSSEPAESRPPPSPMADR